MDPMLLDPSHDLNFEAMVQSCLGLAVTLSPPHDQDSFWLLAAFSRSRLRLSESSVGFILKSVLGCSAVSFEVVEVEEHIFKFSVSSKAAGLLVYNLRSFACDHLKVFFHLWNVNGLTAAKSSPNPGEPFLELNDLMHADGNPNLNLDLNQPMEDDLGGIEDLLLAAGNLEAEHDIQEEVIDEGEPSVDSVEQLALNFDLNEVNNVKVFIPMDNGVPIQMMPDEVQEHDLMDGQEEQEQAIQFPVQEEDPFNQEMQIGFVQLQQPAFDPVFTSRMIFSQPPASRQHASTVKAWAQNLAPGLGAQSAIKSKKAAVVVDSDLRRSERKKKQNRGLKHETCPDKDCLSCVSKPPIIPPSVIRNLGESFCKVDLAKLTVEALGKKGKAAAPGGKRPVVKKTSKDSDNEDTAKEKKIN
ncbi:unnamed protein product [Urochloa decumbens]|uniref:Uncharacterized protein n=1 Tax=Urochloa decumbens TaxID=240449 RepID=A0ABC9DBX1_9POAL